MKITFKCNAIPKKETYPVIKENSKGTIILFTEQYTGVCLSSKDDFYKIGHSSGEWNEKVFTIIPDSVTLYQK